MTSPNDVPAPTPARADTNTPHEISLSLVSHTNVGKTTLARTLLGRDIGEVRDAAHVTELAEGNLLIETPDGDRLLLWDTPGFGDSTRLARRLEQSGNPIGWVLGQVWDRLRDRPLWSGQQAIRNVRERADVVLYLVNAAEDPADAAYVDPEMRILDWMGRPVIALLNQMGAPRPAAEEAAEVERWRKRLAGTKTVAAVLALDAFARCWVQEIALFDAIARVLPEDRRPAFARLATAWRQRGEATFEASMHELAGRLARAALDREPVPSTGLLGTLRELPGQLGMAGARGLRKIGRSIAGDDRAQPDDNAAGAGDEPGAERVGRTEGARRAAMRALAERLDTEVRKSTDRLIGLHGLRGNAGREVLARLAEHYSIGHRVDEGNAAILGGLVTGSLAGLKADLATGGLTLGGGLLAGGLLGALGAMGLARGYNLVRGGGEAAVTWSVESLDTLAESALLGYLTVAHYGRGRGDWSPSEHPPHWEAEVKAALAPQRDALRVLWSRRHLQDAATLQTSLQHELTTAGRRLLGQLYPAAAGSTEAHGRG